MSAAISPLAGKPPPQALLFSVPKLLAAYVDQRSDPTVPTQRVAFGTSGHRGSAFENTFNEWHVLAISQAICDYRKRQGIRGPLFLGIDTHALSVPASASALEVLAANGVDVMLAAHDEYTPTPAVSHAILVNNRGRTAGFANGIVVTPSHNPPGNGSFKYNPPNGGPAENDVTGWIEGRANAFLKTGLQGVKRIPYEKALRSSATHRHDFLNAYVSDLGNVLDMDAIRGANISMGVDPLGGAGVHYWAAIAERYGLSLTVVNEVVDPTFRFMTIDWDGRIRMDPSSSYAMQSLIDLKDRYDIAFACDTDHDRHGIVTRSAGLLPPNHYLAVAIHYLLQHRPRWRTQAAVGKTVVSSQMIVAWSRSSAENFTKCRSASSGSLMVCSTARSASAAKLAPAQLSCASMAPSGRQTRMESSRHCSPRKSLRGRAAIPASCIATSFFSWARRWPIASKRRRPPSKKTRLAKLSPKQVQSTELAGEKIESVLDHAPGNNSPISGIKVTAASGWFAARPSGTEDIYKIYAESFKDKAHMQSVLQEAQSIVDSALTARATHMHARSPVTQGALDPETDMPVELDRLRPPGGEAREGIHTRVVRI